MNGQFNTIDSPTPADAVWVPFNGATTESRASAKERQANRKALKSVEFQVKSIREEMKKKNK